MELSKQVVCLELAKKLKELGVKRESLFYWVSSNYWWGTGDEKLFQKNHEFKTQFIVGRDGVGVSTFTVAELGEMLSKANYNWQNAKYDCGDKKGKWFIAEYANKLQVQEAETEADARAKMLIYLLKKKLINL